MRRWCCWRHSFTRWHQHVSRAKSYQCSMFLAELSLTPDIATAPSLQLKHNWIPATPAWHWHSTFQAYYPVLMPTPLNLVFVGGFDRQCLYLCVSRWSMLYWGSLHMIDYWLTDTCSLTLSLSLYWENMQQGKVKVCFWPATAGHSFIHSFIVKCFI